MNGLYIIRWACAQPHTIRGGSSLGPAVRHKQRVQPGESQLVPAVPRARVAAQFAYDVLQHVTPRGVGGRSLWPQGRSWGKVQG